MADVEVQVPSPLRECFLHCEVNCVRECCGIDAISTEAEMITGWCNQVGPHTVGVALGQLDELIAAVEDRSHKALSTFLNHYTCDEEARHKPLVFLSAFQSALQSKA
jgi:hypothetical protein